MLSKRAAFRLSVMLSCVIGIVYGAARIDRLPPGPRRIVARIGQWLQQEAADSGETSKSVEVPAVAEIREGTQARPSTDFGCAIDGPSVSLPAGNGWPVDTKPVTLSLLPETSLAPVSPSANCPSGLSETLPLRDESSVLAELASQLQSLGATDYLLEKWGDDGELFRFHCEVAIGGHQNLRRHFEAVAPTGEEAIRRVLAEVAESR